MKRILLVEPDFQNKYPPLGLMKISTYHKILGDEVYFVKGNFEYFQNQIWDRIYISTLFTFYWKKTIDCINYYKGSVRNSKTDIIIGGVLATVLPEKLEEAVGIKPHLGLLDKPGILDSDNTIIIDNLAPDYDILDTIEYKYPTADSYMGYMTRGCVRKCAFCAVPKIEPTFKSFISLQDTIQYLKDEYGEKQHLLLMDNNVLGSKDFFEIIDEIIAMGYGKGAKYQEPNMYEFYINKLKQNNYNILYLYKMQKLLNSFFDKLNTKKQLNNKNEIIDIFTNYNLVESITTYVHYSQNSDNYFKEVFSKFLSSYELLSPIYEKYRNKAYKQKYVDFNQGIDGRLLTEKKMAKLAEINIRPIRVAFDDIKDKDIYIEKLILAGKYGVKNSSNYVLYNYFDTPDELYERLRISIDLNREYGLNIYSFPMKYLPIEDVDRKHIGPHWNKKYIRGMQIILNAVHGAVMPGTEFFEVAFGKDAEEFKKILLLPEDYTFFRNKNSENIKQWEQDLDILKNESLARYNAIINLIKDNIFRDIELEDYDCLEQNVLYHYVRKYQKYENFQPIRTRILKKISA